MSDSSLKPLYGYFETDHYHLNRLLQKVKELDALNEQVHTFLDPALRPYCKVANKHQHQLVLLCANGSVATRIHLESEELLKKFSENGLLKDIALIHCLVRPEVNHLRKYTPTKPLSKLSAETAQLVNDIAEAVDDVELREKIKNIARHVVESDS